MKIVNCSESTLRRKLKEDGISLGATHLKNGWQIPQTTLEALGVVETVMTGQITGHDRSNQTNEISRIKEENTQLRIENATLRAENDGLRQVLAEREKVVGLLEQRPAKREHFWDRWRHHDETD